MASNGTTAWSNTVRGIVTDALDENGILPLGSDPSDPEMQKCIRRLNGMLKSWQMQGGFWKHDTYQAPGTANNPTITLPTYVRDVVGCRYIISPTNERTLHRWQWDDYQLLPNKASKGAPTIFYIDRRRDSLSLTLWPVPTASFTLDVDVERGFDTVTAPDQTLDVPEELTETVIANLAVRCCAIFQKEPMPELVARAAMLERQMLDSWRPDSYSMVAGF